jgi:pSer/pThr/pTyr-binding forkhead associated (FHA) protein
VGTRSGTPLCIVCGEPMVTAVCARCGTAQPPDGVRLPPERALPTRHQVTERSVDHTPESGPVRRTIAVVVLDDGQRLEIDGTVLVGRRPWPDVGEHVDQLLPLHDPARLLSKTHARLRWDGGTLWITDRCSTNGTVVLDRDGSHLPVQDTEVACPPGSRITLGARSLLVEHLPIPVASPWPAECEERAL